MVQIEGKSIRASSEYAPTIDDFYGSFELKKNVSDEIENDDVVVIDSDEDIDDFETRIQNVVPSQKFPPIGTQQSTENENFDLAKLDSKDLLGRSLKHSSENIKFQNSQNNENITHNNVSNNANSNQSNIPQATPAPKGPFKITISELGKEGKEITVLPTIKFPTFVIFALNSLGIKAKPGQMCLMNTHGVLLEDMSQLSPNEKLYVVPADLEALFENDPQNNLDNNTEALNMQDEEDEEEAPYEEKEEELGNANDEEEETPKDQDAYPLRTPICCVLGHVDTGKTSLLDKIRQTNVQEGEAGGITQQIGATYFPIETLRKKSEAINKNYKFDFEMPGFIVIDTPGHESFSNLRSRGSSLCDLAILVVDIMHGLEKQTIESIELLKKRRVPFVIALNKIDRLYEWQPTKDAPFKETLQNQKESTVKEFENRMEAIIGEFSMQGLNVVPYYKNKDFRKYPSIVPTSAVSGEGIPDLLLLLPLLSQKFLRKRLEKKANEFLCTVLEVKIVEKLGTTIDVLLVHGRIRKGDRIVLCSLNGPVVTYVRSIITPQPLEELRVKGNYDDKLNEVKGVQGIKLFARGVEKVVPGSQLLVAKKRDNMDLLKKKVMEDLDKITSLAQRRGGGVSVQASTLGSLEALLEFLAESDIPVGPVSIGMKGNFFVHHTGPVKKKDVYRATHWRKAYRCILAFDVPVQKTAAELAQANDVRIFTANIIYHLFDQFKLHNARFKEKEAGHPPCILSIEPEYVFKTSSPIIVGVYVKGRIRVGTPLCVPTQSFLDIGKITAIRGLESTHSLTEVDDDQTVIIKIEQDRKPGQKIVMYGRDFDFTDQLLTKVKVITDIEMPWRIEGTNFMKTFRKAFNFPDIKRNEH